MSASARLSATPPTAPAARSPIVMHPSRLAVILVGCVAVIALWCGIRLHHAHAQVAQSLAISTAHLADLQRCVAAGVVGGAGAPADSATGGDLVAQIQRTLTAAGVAATAFRGVQPIADRLDAAARISERTVQVHFEALKPSDLGAWLAAWCTPGQAGEVTEIAWSHPPSAMGSSIDIEAGLVSVSLRSRTPL